MRITLCLFLVGTIVILYAGCEKTVSQIPDDCEPEFPDQHVTYDNYVKQIVASNCTVSCHRGGGSEGPGNFTTYDGLLPYALKRSFFFRVISANADMPQNNAPLPESVRDSLNIWISNCFPEQ